MGDRARAKLNTVLGCNPDFETMGQIAAVLDGTVRSLPVNMEPTKMALFKYYRMASADVEHSFSVYKAILEDWEQLPLDKIHKILITKCFFNHKNM